MKGIKIDKRLFGVIMTAKVITHLNQKTGKRFKPKAKTNVQLITNWMHSGFMEKEFKLVIDFKVHQWLHIPEMKKYLRPTVLFSIHNFKRYLNDAAIFYNSKSAKLKN